MKLFSKLNATQKRNVFLFGGGGLLLLAIALLSRPGVLPSHAPPVNATNLLGNADPHALGVASLQQGVSNNDSKMAQLELQVKQLQDDKRKQATQPTQEPPSSLQQQNGGTGQPTSSLPPPPVPTMAPGGQMSTPYYGPGGIRQQEQPSVDPSNSPPEIKVMGADSTTSSASTKTPGVGPVGPVTKTTTATASAGAGAQNQPADETLKIAASGDPGSTDGKARNPKIYLPAGSMFPGVLITGLDAPTGREAASQPVPLLIRVKKEAILPNEYTADYSECFIVASGTGDLSSERAYVRGETLSCVAQNGGVIQAKVEMWGTGEDGKAGLRGTLVSKQGSAVAKAILAGFASGLGQAFTPQQQTVITTATNGGYSTIPMGTAGRMAAGNGFSAGANEAAQFFMKLAESEFPIIEVSAGRQVTFVVEKGTELSELQDSK